MTNNIDTGSVESAVGGFNFDFTDNRGTYQDEWKTTGFINSIFDSLNGISGQLEELKMAALEYAGSCENAVNWLISCCPPLIKYIANNVENSYNTGSNYVVQTADSSGRLNIRQNPGMDGSVIGQFDNNTKINVLEINGNWAKVKFKNDDGNETEGWVSTKYITENNSSSPSVSPIPNSVTNKVEQQTNTAKVSLQDASSTLRVRNGAGTTNTVITTIPNGTPVEVLETQNGWSRIKYVDADSKPIEGWVFSDYLGN